MFVVKFVFLVHQAIVHNWELHLYKKYLLLLELEFPRLNDLIWVDFMIQGKFNI